MNDETSIFGDLVGFIKRFMNQAASHLATRGRSDGLHKMEDFYRKKDGARELLIKGLFGGQDVFYLEEENTECFNRADSCG